MQFYGFIQKVQILQKKPQILRKKGKFYKKVGKIKRLSVYVALICFRRTQRFPNKKNRWGLCFEAEGFF